MTLLFLICIAAIVGWSVIKNPQLPPVEEDRIRQRNAIYKAIGWCVLKCFCVLLFVLAIIEVTYHVIKQ